MREKELQELCIRQLARAKQLLASIPVLISVEDYYSAVNRAYYAAFHAIKAIEALDNYDSKKHSGLLSNFRSRYIKTGIFDVKYSQIITSLAQYRQDSDYNILVQIHLEEAQEQYRNAVDFVGAIEAYLASQIDDGAV